MLLVPTFVELIAISLTLEINLDRFYLSIAKKSMNGKNIRRTHTIAGLVVTKSKLPYMK